MTMRAHMFLLTACIGLALMLGGCLPGAEEEKRVLAKNDAALQEVKAEKLVADMSNTVLQMQTQTDINSTTENVNSHRCSVQGGDDLLISYIPKTATFLRDGVVPYDIAEKIRAQLKSRFSPHAVLDATQFVDQWEDCALIEGALIADKSPILVLQQNFAVAQEGAISPDVIYITTEACGDNIPGVKITRWNKHNQKVDQQGHVTNASEDRCGTWFDPNIVVQLTSAADAQHMGDWKKRLTGAGDGVRNVRCIVMPNSTNCLPVSQVADYGKRLQCDEETDEELLVSNPATNSEKAGAVGAAGNVYINRSTNWPEPLAASAGNPKANRDCGRPDWVGKMIARVKRHVCTVKYKDKTTDQSVIETTSEQPALLFDIAYVGARCEKSHVDMPKSCPAISASLSAPRATGNVFTNDYVVMDSPIKLQPTLTDAQHKINTSAITYNGAPNMDASISALATEPVFTAGTDPNIKTGMGFFTSTQDIATLSGPQFDTALGVQAYSQGKNTGSVENKCYVLAQTCNDLEAPKQVAIVADRSQEANRLAERFKLGGNITQCHGALANLFPEDKREDACTAIKEFHTSQRASFPAFYTLLTAEFDANNAVTKGAALFETRKTAIGLAGGAVGPLSSLETWVNQSKKAELKAALLYGFDCNSTHVPPDFYGTCPLSPYAEGFCPASCPGQCVSTPVAGNADANLSQTSDHLLEDVVIRSLPYGTKLTYIESYDNKINTLYDKQLGVANPVTGPRSRLGQYVVNQEAYATAISEINSQISARNGGGGMNDSDNNYKKLNIDTCYFEKNIHRSIWDASNWSFTYGLLLPDSATKTCCDKECNSDWIPSPYDCWWGPDGYGGYCEADGNEVGAWHGNKNALGPPRLYESIDAAIDAMNAPGSALATDRHATASIYVLANGKNDNDHSKSKYFGTNLCAKETQPEKFQCFSEVCDAYWPVVGGCRDWDDYRRDISPGELASLKTNSPGERYKFCENNGHFGPESKRVDTVRVSGGPSVHYDDLVGFLGRHYPNVRVYFVVTDLANLPTECGEERNLYYPDRDTGEKVVTVISMKAYLAQVGGLEQKMFEAVNGTDDLKELGRQICAAHNPNATPVDDMTENSQYQWYDASATECSAAEMPHRWSEDGQGDAPLYDKTIAQLVQLTTTPPAVVVDMPFNINYCHIKQMSPPFLSWPRPGDYFCDNAPQEAQYCSGSNVPPNHYLCQDPSKLQAVMNPYNCRWNDEDDHSAGYLCILPTSCVWNSPTGTDHHC